MLNCDGFPVYEGPSEFISNFIVASQNKYRLYKCHALCVSVTSPSGAVEQRKFNPWVYTKKNIPRKDPSGVTVTEENGEIVFDTVYEWQEDVDGTSGGSDIPVSVGSKELDEMKNKVAHLEKECKRLDDACYFFKQDIFKKERRIKALEAVIKEHDLSKEVKHTG